MLSESRAILLQLARKAGTLMPTDAAGEAQLMRWCVAALNTAELPLMSLLVLDWTGHEAAPATAPGWRSGFVACWATRSGLGGRVHVAPDDFTVADILMAGVLTLVKDDDLMQSPSRVTACRDRCFACPAWQHTLERDLARVEAG